MGKRSYPSRLRKDQDPPNWKEVEIQLRRDLNASFGTMSAVLNLEIAFIRAGLPLAVRSM